MSTLFNAGMAKALSRKENETFKHIHSITHTHTRGWYNHLIPTTKHTLLHYLVQRFGVYMPHSNYTSSNANSSMEVRYISTCVYESSEREAGIYGIWVLNVIND